MLRCVAAEADTMQTGVKIERVARCVPAATDPARGLPKRQVFWDAVAAGEAPAHNESEARSAGQVVRRIGITGLVWTDPDVLLHNKQLYDKGHNEVCAAQRPHYRIHCCSHVFGSGRGVFAEVDDHLPWCAVACESSWRGLRRQNCCAAAAGDTRA